MKPVALDPFLREMIAQEMSLADVSDAKGVQMAVLRAVYRYEQTKKEK